MKIIPLLLSTAIVGILPFGCAVGPDYHKPNPEAPAQWVGLTNSTSAAATTPIVAPADLTNWWTKFQDPKLVSLIDEGFRTNLDLKIAESAVRAARASRGIVAGSLWPSLGGAAGYSRGAVGKQHPTDTFTAGLDAAWELDIFGGNRRNVESANATILAQQENLNDVRVTLAAEIAVDYIQLRSFQEQLAIADENLKSEQRTAELTRRKLAAGFSSALDVANAEAQVATTASTIPVLETSKTQVIYALSVLLARPPGDLLDTLSKPGPVPLTPPQVPMGMPSDLMRRRPDIRQAEAQLHAATAQIGVAKADYFPQFSLTGNINYQSDLVRNLFAGTSRLWGVGPTMTWNILQGGAITANVRLQRELTEQAYLNYRKTILTALQDVESALLAFDKEWDHRKALNEAVAQNRKAVDLSNQLYSQGTIDFLTVLDAERSLYASETALAQSRESISTDLVALYKALGGGWE